MRGSRIFGLMVRICSLRLEMFRGLRVRGRRVFRATKRCFLSKDNETDKKRAELRARPRRKVYIQRGQLERDGKNSME